MKKKVKTVRKDNTVMEVALIVGGFALALALYALWQTSTSTYNEFVKLCGANGNPPTCMGFYWRQFKYYEGVYIGSLYVAVVSAGVAIWAKLKKN